MAEVDIFGYATERLDVLRVEFGALASAHSDLRVKVAGIQTQVQIMFAIITMMLAGVIGTFFHLIQQLARLTGKA